MGIENYKQIYFRSYNKLIVIFSDECCCECWKRRRVVLRGPEVQRKVSHDEVVAIIEDAREGEVEGLKKRWKYTL